MLCNIVVMLCIQAHADDFLEYLDANHGLIRHIRCWPSESALEGTAQEQPKNPWLESRCPTLTGLSVIMERRSSLDLDGDVVVKIRALHAIENMNLIGYHQSMCTDGKPRCDIDILRSFAGLAFSAFAAGRVALVAVAALCKDDVPRPAGARRHPSDSQSEQSDSYSDSTGDE